MQLLFGRSWRQVTRDKPTNIGRAMSQISSAIVFAAIYWRMGRWVVGLTMHRHAAQALWNSYRQAAAAQERTGAATLQLVHRVSSPSSQWA